MRDSAFLTGFDGDIDTSEDKHENFGYLSNKISAIFLTVHGAAAAAK